MRWYSRFVPELSSDARDSGITSEKYRISRIVLARLTAEEYLRSFWWFALIVPVFGITCLLFGSGLLQVIGFMAILWPFSIPARAILSSSKASKLLARGTWVRFEDQTLYFCADEGTGLKLSLNAVRDIVVRGDYLLIRMRRFGFVPILRTALPEGSLSALQAAIAKTKRQALRSPN
jgi:hypothetical protein